MGIRAMGLVIACVAALGTTGCGSDGGSGTGGAASSTGTGGAAGTVDGRDIFVNGDPSTGAAACGACHALKDAGTTGSAGNDLDKLAPGVDAAQIAVMTTDPNATIAPGYRKDVMPRDYATTLTPAQVAAVAAYIDEVSARTP